MANRKTYELAMQIGGKVNSSLNNAFRKTNQQIDKTERNAKQASMAMRGMGNAMRYAVGAVGAYMSFSAIKNFAQESIEAAKAQNLVETKLSAVLQNVKALKAQGPEAYKAATKELIAQAGALQKVGVIGDEVSIAGYQQLATFQLSQKEIKILSAGMADLLAQQKGLNATQEDSVMIGNLMGKVMMGQVGALKKVGISFDKNQEKVLKKGNSIQRALMLAEVLKDNVGGVNAALAKTDQGKIQQMTNNWGDMKEVVGGELLPVLGNIANWIDKKIPVIQTGIIGTIHQVKTLTKQSLLFYDKLKPVVPLIISVAAAFGIWKTATIALIVAQKAGLIINMVAAGIATLPVLCSMAAGGYGILTTAQYALNLAMAANPVGVIIVGLTLLGLLIWKLWPQIKAFAGGIKDGFMDAIKPVMPGLRNLCDLIGKTIGLAVTFAGKLFGVKNAGGDTTKTILEIGRAIGIFIGSIIKAIDFLGQMVAKINDLTGATQSLSNAMLIAFHQKELSGEKNAREKMINDMRASGVSEKEIDRTVKELDSKNQYANAPSRKIKGYATGGIMRGGLAIVGEKGPELVNFPRNTEVTPADKTNQILKTSPKLINFPTISEVTPVDKTRQLLKSIDNIRPGATINYAPVINISGNADKADVKNALNESMAQFERNYNQLMARKQRLGYVH